MDDGVHCLLEYTRSYRQSEKKVDVTVYLIYKPQGVWIVVNFLLASHSGI